MIIALRKRHRLIIVGLSFLVPIGFAIGISARSSIPAGNHARLNGSRTLGRTSEVWARDDLWVGKTIATRLLKEDGLIAQFGIELNSHEPIVHPDLLVYWVRSEQKISDSLPEDGILLGSFVGLSPTVLGLPPQATIQSGMLVLYSLADHEVIAVSKGFSPTNQR